MNNHPLFLLSEEETEDLGRFLKIGQGYWTRSGSWSNIQGMGPESYRYVPWHFNARYVSSYGDIRWGREEDSLLLGIRPAMQVEQDGYREGDVVRTACRFYSIDWVVVKADKYTATLLAKDILQYSRWWNIERALDDLYDTFTDEWRQRIIPRKSSELRERDGWKW